MSKVGILTFHYSNNYGGVLQALALYRIVESLGYDVEIIDYIPSNYRPNSVLSNLGIRNLIFKNDTIILDILDIYKKINIKINYCKAITNKFNHFRINNMKLSQQVNENSLKTILNDYSAIIVGSDQVWNPSQRKSPIYFLNFGDNYKGKKISYAADSTIKDVDIKDLKELEKALSEFRYISVRNDHSYEFVKTIINKEVEIVADPTLLYDFNNTQNVEDKKEDYILTYILGKEIEGSHNKAIEKIRKIYSNMPVYSIKIPTMNLDLSPIADKVFYDLNPEEWMNMIMNARFIYTDSFHGVLFSLKYHKPFLAYYSEKLRATRFTDIGKKYNIDKYIVQNIAEIDDKQSLDELPDFNSIDNIINLQKKSSIDFLKKALSE